MKNRLLLIFATTVLLPFSTTKAVSTGDTKLDSAIQKANSEFLSAMKTGDAAIIAAPYADQGIFMLPDGNCIRGRSEVEKMYRTSFERAGLASSTSIDSKNVFVDGDLAYESGSAEIGLLKEGKLITRNSRYLTVWHRGPDGDWKIIRNIVMP